MYELPDCWVVSKEGRIIGTYDEPVHIYGIDAVRYVPATEAGRASRDAEVEALRADRDQLQRDFTYMKQQRDTAQAELAKLREQEPVAWAMKRSDGLLLDLICPEEHESFEGQYKVPLYADPRPAAAPAEELSVLLATIDKKCGSGHIPWEIEDAYAAYEAKLKGGA